MLSFLGVAALEALGFSAFLGFALAGWGSLLRGSIHRDNREPQQGVGGSGSGRGRGISGGARGMAC